MVRAIGTDPREDIRGDEWRKESMTPKKRIDALGRVTELDGVKYPKLEKRIKDSKVKNSRSDVYVSEGLWDTVQKIWQQEGRLTGYEYSDMYWPNLPDGELLGRFEYPSGYSHSLPMTYEEYNTLMRRQPYQPMYKLPKYVSHQSHHDEWVMMNFDSGQQYLMGRNEFRQLLIYNKQNPMAKRDTLFVDEEHGRSGVYTAAQADQLQQEYHQRQQETTLVAMKNGNTVYVTKQKAREMEKAGELWSPDKEREGNPIVTTAVEKREPEVDEVTKEVIDSLEPRALLDKYIENVEIVEGYDNSTRKVKAELLGFKEPEYVEDIDEYEQYRLQLESLKELANETETNNKKAKEEVKKEQLYVIYAIANSERIPQNKWVKVRDYGVKVVKQNGKVTNHEHIIQKQLWTDVKPDSTPVKKKDNPGAYSVIELHNLGVTLSKLSMPVGALTSVGVLIATAFAAYVVFGLAGAGAAILIIGILGAFATRDKS